MKQIKIMMLIIALSLFPKDGLTQTTVKVEDLNFTLSGTTASVTYIKNKANSYNRYTNTNYNVPPTINYNGLDYIVNAIDEFAFASLDYPYKSPYASAVSSIILPSTIIAIRKNAFSGCGSLTSINLVNCKTIDNNAFRSSGLPKIIIPATLDSFGENVFLDCDLLREIIYLPTTAPTNWTATTATYVPDKQSYSSPRYIINDGQIIEMITFRDTEFEYSELLGKSPTTIWTNNVSGYDADLSMPTLSGEVGNHEVWIPVTFKKNGESFIANVVYRYTIKPVKLMAKVTNASREYGEDNPQFKVTYSGFVNGENEDVITTKPTVTTNATKTSNVGDYTLTASGGVAGNYELVYEPGVLTITKAPLSAKVNDATKVYGSPNPAFTIDYFGLKNEETAPQWSTNISFKTEADQGSAVGKYEVNAINGVPINYDMGEITAGSLTITPAPLTIKANDATRQYYSSMPQLSYSCNGFVNGEDENVLTTKPQLTTTASLSSDVGTYPIKVSDATSPNYSISFVNGTLTITKRTLIASVGNYERDYNKENPDFEIKYDGFAGNDNENVFISKPQAKTTATKTSDVGTYTIDVSGGDADNYQFSYTSGVLTINKAEQKIYWQQYLNSLKVGDQVELKAVSTSGLPITYTMEGTNKSEVYSTGKRSYLDCKEEGSFVIKAVQTGNSNYYSSARNSKNVVIGPIDSTVEQRMYADVDGDGNVDAADIVVITNIIMGK